MRSARSTRAPIAETVGSRADTRVKRTTLRSPGFAGGAIGLDMIASPICSIEAVRSETRGIRR
jgi:hypothetical protein